PAGDFMWKEKCGDSLTFQAGKVKVGAIAQSPFFNFYSDLLVKLNDAKLTVIPFPYDWRLDFQTNAELLYSLIHSPCIVSDSSSCISPDPSALVDVVVHSQGGLVAQTYLNTILNDHRIHSIIYLATLHAGTPKTYAIVKGWASLEDYFPMSNLPI